MNIKLSKVKRQHSPGWRGLVPDGGGERRREALRGPNPGRAVTRGTALGYIIENLYKYLRSEILVNIVQKA